MILKRTFDFLLSTFGIICFLPLGLLFALLIKIGDGGHVFYTQERWGKSGKKFKAYKFRTMIVGADQKFGFKPAAENDHRITFIGRFLRATAMDELPQLLNIWKGDMSFVGPRAIAVTELDSSFPGFEERHQIQPGLTGPSQIHLPRTAGWKEKFQQDMEYIKTRSFTGDLRLIFLSVWITLLAKWEIRGKKV